MKLLQQLVFALLASTALASTYQLDTSHGEIEFSVKHLGFSNVKGRFNKYSGTFDFDEAKKELKNIKVEIQTSSVDTNDADRDKHLRGADFFNVDNFATLVFVGDKVIFSGNKPVSVTGQLTLLGQTKPIELQIDYGGAVVDPWGKSRVAFSLKGKLNRKDYGMVWNKALDKGGVAVGEEVQINIESEALKN